jgi:hypothetical protein
MYYVCYASRYELMCNATNVPNFAKKEKNNKICLPYEPLNKKCQAKNTVYCGKVKI